MSFGSMSFLGVGRLESHLNQTDDLDQKVKAALPGLWLPMVRDDTPIILDLSDIAKPLAMKMEQRAVNCP